MRVFYVLCLFLVAQNVLILGKSTENQTDIAKKAFIYGYPLVLFELTRESMKNEAPPNVFVHMRSFPNRCYEDQSCPNIDTLYSTAWIDLSKEPILLSLPNAETRYYSVELLDAWTNVFSSLGTRTTGNHSGLFALIGPDTIMRLPDGMKEIRCPTNNVWLICRIQIAGFSDKGAAETIQDQFQLIPISSEERDRHSALSFKPKEKGQSPMERISGMDAPSFFTKMAELLQKNPPPDQDTEIIKKCASIGLVAGENFDSKNIKDSLLKEITQGVKLAKKEIKQGWEKQSFAKKINGWLVAIDKVGTYGTNYLLRAIMAYGAMGTSLPEDALYLEAKSDAHGKTLNGSMRYLIHFSRDQLPSVDAFWSLTLYNEHQFFTPNKIDRYSIGNRDTLTFNEDGSLDIFVQKRSPGKEKEPNWLPAPTDDFSLILRLYQPKEEVLKKSWNPPPILRVY